MGPNIPRLNDRRRTTKLFLAACVITVTGFLFFIFGIRPAVSDEQKMLSIVFREGQTLRSVANEYLGDPNLWPEIMRVNKLTSINQVQPGVKLKIPANEISLANSAIESALLKIQKATESGARVFAPELLDGALKMHAQALAHRRQSEWQACFRLAQGAGTKAEKALNKSRSLRKTSTQAVLQDRTGIVESRKTAELVWNSIEKGTFMVEKEKVRTKSESTGEILFVDESKLRMGANSQVVIQALQVDRLNNRQKSSITLVGGDVYALLASSGSGKKKSFDLQVPGVSLDSASLNYWVNRQKSKTLIANYDNQYLNVSASDVTVTLKRNQGTIVTKQRAPTPANDLLRPPGLKTPKHETVRSGGNVKLTWKTIAGASAYHLEVARDISFHQMYLVKPRLKATASALQDLDDGSYYWRVATIDKYGFPGEFSRIRRFWISHDVTAPHLIIITPEQGQIIRSQNVRITGKAEPLGALEIAGKPVEILADGGFSHDMTLPIGKNRIVIAVKDSAGNLTRRSRSVICMPDERAPVRYDDHLTSIGPKKFVTRSDAFVLSGYTAPNARIDVIREGEPLTAGAHTDASGRFRLKLPVTRHQQVLQLRIKVPSGFVTQDEFVLMSDTQPPDLTLDKAPPSNTADSTLRLAGTLNSGKSLFFNDTPVEIEHDRFRIDTKLAEGPNRLVLIARDVVGNERRWEKTIWLDREPPRLIDAKIVTPRPQIPGEIEVIVRAKDATGMKRYAWVTLKGGNMNKTVRLLLIDKSSGIYHKAMTVSGLSTGQIALINVRLEDYLGNQHVYDLE